MMKLRKLFPAVLMAIVLAVHSAGAENMIQINGDQSPKSAEELLQMVEEATDDYYRDQEVAEELRGEISCVEMDDGSGGKLTVYTLEHGGNAMRFLMKQKGEPDENGRYPLYITLHHRFHRQGQGGEHRTEHRSNQDIQDARARDHPDMGDVMGITGLYPNPDPEGRVGKQDKAKADPSRSRKIQPGQ